MSEPIPVSEVDLLNRAMVASDGDTFSILMPSAAQRMTGDQALVLAAWLVAVAEREDGRFSAILDRVLAT